MAPLLLAALLTALAFQSGDRWFRLTAAMATGACLAWIWWLSLHEAEAWWRECPPPQGGKDCGPRWP